MGAVSSNSTLGLRPQCPSTHAPREIQNLRSDKRFNGSAHQLCLEQAWLSAFRGPGSAIRHRQGWGDEQLERLEQKLLGSRILLGLPDEGLDLVDGTGRATRRLGFLAPHQGLKHARRQASGDIL
jgi:hypothetical protein